MIFIGNGGHAKVCRTLGNRSGLDSDVVIAIGNNCDRKHEAEARPNVRFAILKHRLSYSELAREIGEGTVIMAGVIIQPGVRIGKHVILNTGCTIDHDCVIEDYAHIAPGAHLCGNVRVGEGALVVLCGRPFAELLQDVRVEGFEPIDKVRAARLAHLPQG